MTVAVETPAPPDGAQTLTPPPTATPPPQAAAPPPPSPSPSPSPTGPSPADVAAAEAQRLATEARAHATEARAKADAVGAAGEDFAIASRELQQQVAQLQAERARVQAEARYRLVADMGCILTADQAAGQVPVVDVSTADGRATLDEWRENNSNLFREAKPNVQAISQRVQAAIPTGNTSKLFGDEMAREFIANTFAPGIE